MLKKEKIIKKIIITIWMNIRLSGQKSEALWSVYKKGINLKTFGQSIPNDFILE